MNEREIEMTAPITSAVHKESLSSRGALAKGFHYVGADVGQSLNSTIHSIAEETDDYKTKMKMLREMQRCYDPNYLQTISMNDLYEQSYTGKPSIIDGLLYSGTYLLAGAPKVGKSFLVAQLAYHVSTGQPLWDYPVRRGGVLYLALEDDFQRLQSRMFRMFGVNGTDNLHFAIGSAQIGNGLDRQLENYLRDQPGTRLVIIDTLQKIRAATSEAYSYASDYEAIGQIKQFADKNGICFLLVHHTRKQQAEDKFEMISGTTGLLGCADGAFLLRKAKRTDLTATLDVVGRDQPDQRFYLVKDEEKLLWNLDDSGSGCKASDGGQRRMVRQSLRAGGRGQGQAGGKRLVPIPERQDRQAVGRIPY